MQATEIISNSKNWIILVVLFLFLLIFALRILSYQKLKNNVFSLLDISTIEDDIDIFTELNTFQILFFVFNSTLLSLLFFCFKVESKSSYENSFFNFTTVFFGVLLFLTIKKIIEQVLLYIFNLKKVLNFFLKTKAETLNSFAIVQYVLLVLLLFTNLTFSLVLIVLVTMLVYRLVLIVIKNNNLIFSELFYFILYLCAFEIAPLFILFKMMF